MFDKVKKRQNDKNIHVECLGLCYMFLKFGDERVYNIKLKGQN